MLNLKIQSIYIKPLSKPLNTFNKPCFETVYLDENVINLLHPKVDQNITISLVCLIFSKNHNEPPKVAQLANNHPIWSPCLPFLLSFNFILFAVYITICNCKGCCKYYFVINLVSKLGN